MTWERLLLIAAGGALGALLRYGVGALVADRLGPTVLGHVHREHQRRACARASSSGLTRGALDCAAARTAGDRYRLPRRLHDVLDADVRDALTWRSPGRLFTAFVNIAGSAGAGLLAVYAGLVAIGRNV